MSKNIKHSKVKLSSKEIKEPNISNNRNVIVPISLDKYKQEKFNWCINTILLKYSCDKKFHIYKETVEEMKQIFDKIDSYRSWIWRDIERSFNDTSCGYMPISKLDVKDMVNDHLKRCNRDDDVLYKIEINNNHRVWGIREGSLCYIIWDDNGHFFYKHENKNFTSS